MSGTKKTPETWPTTPVVAKAPDNWGTFLHWVYCPDGPGPCKCDKK